MKKHTFKEKKNPRNDYFINMWLYFPPHVQKLLLKRIQIYPSKTTVWRFSNTDLCLYQNGQDNEGTGSLNINKHQTRSRGTNDTEVESVTRRKCWKSLVTFFPLTFGKFSLDHLKPQKEKINKRRFITTLVTIGILQKRKKGAEGKGGEHRFPIFLDYPSFLRVQMSVHLQKCQLYLKV